MFLYLAMIDEPSDKEKFIDIYETYFNLMYSVAFDKTNDRYISQDIVQEAFISIAKNIKKIENPCSKTKNLCVLIVRNKCIDYFRRTKDGLGIISIETVAETVPGNNSPLEKLETEENLEQVIRAMEMLGEDERIIIQMRYFHEYTQREIARILDITPKKVNMKLFRAKKKLIDILGEG